MKKDNYLNILSDFGLSSNEARVYFACLTLGPSTILRISKEAAIKRTTVYSVVEDLKHKGLITIQVKGFKRLFVAENPRKLAHILQTKKDRLQAILPEFQALYNLKGGESFIKYYEGIESVKTAYDKMLADVRPHQDYLVVGDSKQWLALDPDFFEKFIERRAKLNIRIRLLLVDSKESRRYKKYEKNYNMRVKILPKRKNLTTNFIAIPSRILFHNLTPPVSVITIDNPNVVNTHKELFEIIWSTLE